MAIEAIEVNYMDPQIEGLKIMFSMDKDEESGKAKIRNMILIKDREFYFIDEFDSNVEIQQETVRYEMQNIPIFCLNLNDKHQLYVSR